MSQWAVYAIRNLMEQNERNQEFIARMEERRLADNTALESMGLEVVKRDNNLILRSARKKPSWMKQWRAVKLLKEVFPLKTFPPVQAIRISSVLVPACWKWYIHSQKCCQMILWPHCCKQRDTYPFSKCLSKFICGKKMLLFRRLEFCSFLLLLVETCHVCGMELLQLLFLSLEITIIKNSTKK